MIISGSVLSLLLVLGEYSLVDEYVFFVSVTVVRLLLLLALVLDFRLLLDDLELILDFFRLRSEGQSFRRGSTSGT